MDGFNRVLAERAGTSVAGLSKISVQTGTSHGGVVLPDGSIQDVKLDLDALAALSREARERYGLAGAVQHGASTLPESAFHHFPRVEAAEIHLATNFQNLLFDGMPDALRAEIYRWLDENAAGERKDSDTDEQFYYKTRKKALGPFKQAIWEMPESAKERLADTYDRTFGFLFEQLRVGDTAEAVAKFITPPAMHRSPDGGGTVAAAPDDAEAGE
jgi:hypothetical protein